MKILRTPFYLFAMLMGFLTCGAAIADSASHMEMIELRHRTAVELIPMIEPLLEKDGAISGQGFTLIIRTSPDNLSEIKAMIERLDSPPRRLLVTVKRVNEAELNQLLFGVRGKLSTEGNDIRIRTHRTETDRHEMETQQVQVLEGNSAYIHFGKSVPIGQRNITVGPGGTMVQDTIRYQPLTSGFYVVPRLSEGHVTLFISPHKFAQSRGHGGIINVQQAQTTLRGPLGEWLVIGGTGTDDEHEGTGYTYRTEKRGEQQEQIVVKVEEIH